MKTLCTGFWRMRYCQRRRIGATPWPRDLREKGMGDDRHIEDIIGRARATHGNGVFCGSKRLLYFSMAGPDARGLLKHPGM